MRIIFFAVFVFVSSIGSALADNVKPSTVNNLSASAISNTSVRLRWQKPDDNVGVVGYNLYRDERYFTTVYDQTDYIDENLNANQLYSYYAVAFDNAKNFSSKSSVVLITTGSDGGGNVDERVSGDVPALSATVETSSLVRLSWSSPSGNVEGFNIYKNGRYISTVKDRQFYLDDSVRWGNNYEYYITYFADGQFSRKSQTVRVSTNDSTPAAPPPPQPAAPENDSGSAVPAGYELIFSDEFDSGSIDSSKWNTRYRWGADWIINNEQQYYVDYLNDRDFGHSPFYLDDGKLNISAIRTPGHLWDKARNQPFLSGAMTTFNKFKMKYGYVEMRARLPRGKGLWPAFWLLHQGNDGNRPEIDVMELLGDDTRLVYQTYHYFDNWTLRSTPSFQAPGPDYSTNYHTFGMRWERGRIIWYVDGVETNRFESGSVADEDMYILVNLALGGSWAGSPDGTTPFPATYSIDYIRAYQAR
ncbi:MAG: family 16 glycosylhydrolase [Granulosicoccus sp.]